jgi:response regulator NasT
MAGAAETYRILLADEDRGELARLGEIVEQDGHDVIALAVTVTEAANAVATHEPDLSLILVHSDHDHALGLVAEIKAFASGAVAALVHEVEEEITRSAARLGVDVFLAPHDHDSLSAAIELSVRRHRERMALTRRIGELENAIQRRAVIERAKGILMAQKQISEQDAFEVLRTHARNNGRRIVDLAEALTSTHPLLGAEPPSLEPQDTHEGADRGAEVAPGDDRARSAER